MCKVYDDMEIIVCLPYFQCQVKLRSPFGLPPFHLVGVLPVIIGSVDLVRHLDVFVSYCFCSVLVIADIRSGYVVNVKRIGIIEFFD